MDVCVSHKKTDIKKWEGQRQQNIFTPELYSKLRFQYYKKSVVFYKSFLSIIDYNPREELPFCIVLAIKGTLGGAGIATIWHERVKRDMNKTGKTKEQVIEAITDKYEKYEYYFGYKEGNEPERVVFALRQ